MGAFGERLEQYYENENAVFAKFETSLKGSNLKLERGHSSRNQSVFIDGSIKTLEGYPYAIIEIKYKVYLNEPNLLDDVRHYLSLIPARYVILTDNESFYLLDSTKEYVFEEHSYEDIVHELFNSISKPYTELICDYLNKHFDSLLWFENDICFDGNKYTLKKEKERKLIEQLFKFKDYKEPIYRYTSLNTVFEMLKNKNIRMMGIAGMNDASEVNYVEKFLYPSDSQPLNPEINNVFITSCSKEKEDNLTQWRLYADDAKGARLKFNVNKSKHNFIIREIIYCDIKNDEKILRLKGLVDFVRDKTGLTFVFCTLHEWSHFIKPKDYKVEDEVRLLYLLPQNESPKGWILANNINIITPYVEFDLDENFPLTIEDIKLGPKCPEQRINKYQLNEMLKKLDSKYDDNVKESSIKNYR